MKKFTLFLITVATLGYAGCSKSEEKSGTFTIKGVVFDRKLQEVAPGEKIIVEHRGFDPFSW